MELSERIVTVANEQTGDAGGDRPPGRRRSMSATVQRLIREGSAAASPSSQHTPGRRRRHETGANHPKTNRAFALADLLAVASPMPWRSTRTGKRWADEQTWATVVAGVGLTRRGWRRKTGARPAISCHFAVSARPSSCVHFGCSWSASTASSTGRCADGQAAQMAELRAVGAGRLQGRLIGIEAITRAVQEPARGIGCRPSIAGDIRKAATEANNLITRAKEGRYECANWLKWRSALLAIGMAMWAGGDTLMYCSNGNWRRPAGGAATRRLFQPWFHITPSTRAAAHGHRPYLGASITASG